MSLLQFINYMLLTAFRSFEIFWYSLALSMLSVSRDGIPTKNSPIDVTWSYLDIIKGKLSRYIRINYPNSLVTATDTD